VGNDPANPTQVETVPAVAPNRAKALGVLIGSRDPTFRQFGLATQLKDGTEAPTVIPEGGTAIDRSGHVIATGGAKRIPPMFEPNYPVGDGTKVQPHISLDNGQTWQPAPGSAPSPKFARQVPSMNISVGAAGLSPEQTDALYGPNGAVTTGKLDPYKINSRSAKILADAYLHNPNIDMNKLGSDASMMRNTSFMNRALTLETLPEVMQNMVTAGKKIGYSDNRTVGKMQAFMKGEFNDPDYTSYMAQRNDALMSIASAMRGVGMSDQAHRAEIEAASPTMSPAALDAWLQAQQTSLAPRLKRYEHYTRSGENPATSQPAAPAPVVGDYSKLWGGQ
jgi:hypothetical protein